MTAGFGWKVFGPEHSANPPALTVAVEIPGINGPVTVEGIFDTGADGVELHEDLRGPLGIEHSNCVPTSQTGP